MTENEAIEKLRAYHKCQKMQVKGIYEDCNARLCDNCDLCYAQGNTGEHIKSIEIAIQALEKQIAKKPTFEGDGYAPDGTLVYDTWICPCCDKRYEVDYDDYDYCPNCGQKLDLDRDEQPTAFSMGAKPIDNFVNPFEVKAGGNS